MYQIDLWYAARDPTQRGTAQRTLLQALRSAKVVQERRGCRGRGGGRGGCVGKEGCDLVEHCCDVVDEGG